MKTLVLRRGIFLGLSIVGLLLFLFIFAINDSDDSSDILSDSSRRLPKSQNPNQTGDLANIQMDRPNGSDLPTQDFERLNGLESQIGALHGNMEKFSSLNRDDSQGKGSTNLATCFTCCQHSLSVANSVRPQQKPF